MDDGGTESPHSSENVPPPARQESREGRLSLGGPKPVAMDSYGVARLLRGVCPLPIPEDDVDLVARPRQGCGLLRDSRLETRRALRANEDDASRHVIPDAPRPVVRFVFRSSRLHTDLASPASRRAVVERRRAPAPGPSRRGRSIRSPTSRGVPCSPAA